MGSFSAVHWIIVAVLAYLVIKTLGNALSSSSKAEMICPACGTRGPAKMRVGGSFMIEVILWLMFIVPGLIYSIWRLTTKKPACASCGSTAVIPIDTPMGAELASKYPAR